MAAAKQRFDTACLMPGEIPREVEGQLSREDIAAAIRPGMRIAVTCGSRGVANIALIIRSVVDFVKSRGGVPYAVPAMGSHGGATDEGQRALMESYGMTEEYLGCPIHSSMETKPVGTTEEGHTVRIDRFAAESDGIIVVGRVKPHTSFRGPYESGLMKMMAIGLGKQQGAETCHEAGFGEMARMVPMFGNVILKNAPVICGLALLENAYEQTREIVAVPAGEIPAREPALLEKAKRWMARIYLSPIDLLIVDKIGKDISGDGMDPNITGAFASPYGDGGISAQRIAVLDLTDNTHGSAYGIGMAHTTTRRLFDKMDFEMTYPNAITCTVLEGARIPMVMASDKEAIQVALKSCTGNDKRNPRVIRIHTTLELDRIEISEALLPEARRHPDMELEGEPFPLPFNAAGNLW
jgi:hypothetical protein